MPIRLVVFDMAGTTVDDPGVVNRGFREALAAVGVEPEPARVDALMGLPKPEAIRTLVSEAGRLDATNLGAVLVDFNARMVRHYRSDPEVRAVPEIEPLFARLRDLGILVALDTGFHREIADAILDRLGWSVPGTIDGLVASDEVPEGRPHPDMIHHLMAALGVEHPEEVAKVGDAPADLDEGTNAGCGLVIGVTWGTNARTALERRPHNHLVDRVAELVEILTMCPSP